jgi:hypothetical protein
MRCAGNKCSKWVRREPTGRKHLDAKTVWQRECGDALGARVIEYRGGPFKAKRQLYTWEVHTSWRGVIKGGAVYRASEAKQLADRSIRRLCKEFMG